MNILIDIRALSNTDHGGVGVYIRSVIKYLLKTDKKNKYFFYCNSFKKVKINKNTVLTRYPNIIYNILLSFFRYPKIDKIVSKKTGEKIDIFFVPDPRPSPVSKKCKKITTFHDLSFLLFKKTFNLKTRLWHKILRPKKEAKDSDKIIAVSNSTKKDLIKYYNIDQEKIEVVYEGVETRLEPVTKALPKRFFFFISTIEPRKNIVRMVKGFIEWKKENDNDIKLVIAGKRNNRIFSGVSVDGYTDDVIFIGYIPEEEKYSVIKLALGVVYVSLYEGFGLPIIEAFSCGKGVITSNVSSMPEIAEGGGVLVDPYSIESIKQGFSLFLGNRIELEKNVDVLYRKYSWDKTAREMIDVFMSSSLGEKIK